MAKAKNTPGKKPASRASDKGSKASDKVGVLIEFKVPKTRGFANMASASALNLAASLNIQLDPEFEPVPITPSNTQRANMLAANEDNEHVIMRAQVSQGDIEKIKKNADVVEVWSDAPIEPFACPIPPCDCSPGTAKGNMTDVANYLGVNQIWAKGKKGDGIVVGVVDGGITATGRTLIPGEAPPSGTIPNVIGGWPTASWGTQGKSWGYHGNMCSTDVLGMAPNCRIYDLRIASSSTAGTISNALAAFSWAITQHRANGTPHVLTNSWGMFQKSWAVDYATNPNHPFTRKVIEAINEGIIVLFAAGNCGDTCPDGRCSTDKGPGKSIWGANGHPRVMTVGAVNKNEQFVGYSSQGPAALDAHKPDFCSITHFKGYFTSDSGTSAATPIAAGLVALLKQAKPSATHNSIKKALIDTAKNIGPAGWDQHSGAGIIRGKAAYDKLVGVIKIKDLKDAKREKIEIKEAKTEKQERKEGKIEKLERKELKDVKSEKLEIDERIKIPGKPPILPGAESQSASLEERISYLESLLSSFIESDLRPDLSSGALTHEEDYDNESFTAQQQKFEFDNIS